MRIQTKYALLFLALSLLPLAGIGTFAYRNSRQAIEESLGVLFQQRALRAVETLDREVLTLERRTQEWSGLEVMQDTLHDDIDGRILAFLIEQARHPGPLVGARVSNQAGLVVAASRPVWVGGQRPPPRPASGEPCSEDSAEGTTTLTCRFPIQAAFDDSRVIGEISVTWRLSPVFEAVQGQQLAGGVGAGELLLLRGDGLVVSATARRRNWVLRRNLAEAGSRTAALAASRGGGYLVENLGDGDYLVGYARSPGPWGWTALVAAEVDIAFAPVEHLRRIVFGMGALVGVGVVALSFVLAGRLTRPLLEIEESAGRVAQGQFDLRVTPRTQDEVGSLARSFDAMVQELRRQRAQLVEKAYLDSIIRHMADGLLVVDAAGGTHKVNPAILGWLGCSESEALEREAGCLFAEGSAAFEERVIRPTLRDRSARDVQLGLLRRDGTQVPVSLSAAALPAAEGAAQEIACVVVDISQRKAVERALLEARAAAEAAVETKAQFLATMSHEIRTPLNGVIGMLDLLSETPLDPMQRDYAETARRSGESLLVIVDDILDFSRLEAGRLELETIELDLRGLLDSVLDVLALSAHEKGLELAAVVDETLPARVIGDPSRLRQVLLNLGSNAVKFTPDGEVVIHVELDPRGANRVRFAVEDSGIGIASDRADRLFKPFSQGDASTTRQYGGTGLGLAISARLVEAMGGEIGFERREGRGSLFWFVVPLPPAQAADSASALRYSMHGLRALVVDDNATNRRVLRGMLRLLDCAVDEAADAWEALDKLRAAAERAQPFELALLDFQMPEMDGGQLAAAIRADPRLARTPLVLLTSIPQQGGGARMGKLGFDAYLEKPVRQAQLRRALASVLGERQVPGPAPAPPASGARPARILVVDDNDVSQKLAVKVLEAAGHACDVAASGTEALLALERREYALVFMDVQMPEMDGLEATRRIRRAETGRRTPIVAMTARALRSDRELCLQAGMDDVLVKPFRRADFHRMLERHLAGG